ncbi:6-pyruvoyl tetrahydropterin synthase [Megasphaera cerevisiae DSM 20462]|uniref:6-carboxy-5,6,7,8-tetrahydropterin synthase n=1 Tax=Megasphaera cerevisiae DSM 20462 TaxID=1122219 RepID=A0A0J6X0Y5_9FIRM|nr:6-carboxytetrahydropterin synthase QueD [Megasphaera cerevisiae]KMO87822.1 6-pyruvoyl tetrahydropterin synthase [Megasphaera cerevisiae DSM 20462]MCI1750185.1 6-carboxytetrahydropterin synthase QueD [Megasphaera cerevisiae]OKY54391.1 6-carboxytetrahydropterin synthase QueD [Megasphaera cerevisiae]SJZ50326.1 6-pyruvoyltetrahydropterin/6-carboxytetrahydropterin synthase [Megasphaera cerevisiae DSM 20462]
MYTVIKKLEISAAHHLVLDYESKCENLHGHNWIIYVTCQAESLDANGMVIDFKKIKELIHGTMDHHNLNDVFDFNPTAENIAKWICDTVPNCVRAEVRESEGNTAVYEK